MIYIYIIYIINYTCPCEPMMEIILMLASNMSWKAQKKKLQQLIKKLSSRYGGDSDEFLNEYFNELVERYKDDLSVPIKCFEDLTNEQK